MMVKRLFAAIAIASAPVGLGAKTGDVPTIATAPALPDALLPHVTADRPVLGDCRWIWGKFPGASARKVAITKIAQELS